MSGAELISVCFVDAWRGASRFVGAVFGVGEAWLSEWSAGLFEFAKSVAYESGRIIASCAVRDGKRRNLSWVSDTLLAGIADELEAQGVTRKVAADMFGVSLRTYQRQVSRDVPAHAGVTTSTMILTRLRRGAATRAEILSWFPSSRGQEVGSILSDMIAAGVLSPSTDDTLTPVVEEDAWSEEDLRCYLRVAELLGEPLEPARLAAETGVEEERWRLELEVMAQSTGEMVDPSQEDSRFKALLIIWKHIAELIQQTPGYNLGFWAIASPDEGSEELEELVAELFAARERLTEFFQKTEGIHGPIQGAQPIYSWLFSFGRSENK